MRTAHQLTRDSQTFNHAARVFTFQHLMYLNTLYSNTVFVYIKIKVQRYKGKYTNAYTYCPTPYVVG